MIKARIILCAENVIRDAEANTISAINIIEGLVAQAFPVFVPKLFVLGILTRESGDPSQVKIKLEVSLANSKIFNQEAELDFEDKLNTRYIISIIGFALSAPGQLRFTFLEGRRKVGTYDVFVALRDGPEVKEIGPTSKAKSSKKSQDKPAKA